MLITHDELAFCLKLRFPNSRNGIDYFVAMPVDVGSNAQAGQAFIAKWNLAEAQPSEEDVNTFAVVYETPLSEMRAAQARIARLPNISARQLWLMAKEVNITKASILASLDTLEDQDEAETLRIELTEPPLEGYDRFSPAVETLREMQGIPVEQFDDLWAWASQIK